MTLSYPLSHQGREELSAPLSAGRRGVGGEVDAKENKGEYQQERSRLVPSKPHSYSTQPPPRYPLATVVGREISRRSVAQEEKASLARLDASAWHERKSQNG